MKESNNQLILSDKDINEATDLLEKLFHDDLNDGIPRFTSLKDLANSLEDDDDNEEESINNDINKQENNDQNNNHISQDKDQIINENIEKNIENSINSLNIEEENIKDYEENVKFVDTNLIVERKAVTFTISKENLEKWNTDMNDAYKKLFIDKKFD